MSSSADVAVTVDQLADVAVTDEQIFNHRCKHKCTNAELQICKSSDVYKCGTQIQTVTVSKMHICFVPVTIGEADFSTNAAVTELQKCTFVKQ